MREIVLYIAMSLDGYIADKNGGVDWLCGHDENNQNMGSYPEFIKTVDTVILGYKTYHQIVTDLSPESWIYSGMKSYVITHKKHISTDEIVFTDHNIGDLISELKKRDGKNIWICGGASITNQLIALDLIDRYCITIIPTILGDGVQLFEKQEYEKKLILVSTQSYGGMTDLIFKKRY